MDFHELFLQVRASETKDLEYSSLLSKIREFYEAFVVQGQNDEHLASIIKRLENITYMVNTNDFVEMVNVSKEVSSFDYASEFNPTQKGAINLLLSVVESSQKGIYIKGFFGLYVWKNLLPDVQFYSVGLTDGFYALAEEANVQGEYVFKPADEICQQVEAQKQTIFFQMDEEEHCDAVRRLIAEIDRALDFIVHQY